METVLSDLTVSMSDFKKNPAKVLRDAGKKPVAVLNHNKAAFYMIAPDVYEDLLESVYDRETKPLIQASRTQTTLEGEFTSFQRFAHQPPEKVAMARQSCS